MIDIPENVSSIKQAAEFTGLSEDTIRYYEKIGLLPYADREANGRRKYNKHQVTGMFFLQRLKSTRMTINEMKHFQELYEKGSSTIPERVSILIEHKNKIQDEIDRLLETQRVIEYKIKNYSEFLGSPDLNNTACESADSQ